jgi:hypothetical protein
LKLGCVLTADQLDDEEPMTALQFRLHDGSRAQANFNHTHTVADVRQYLDHVTGYSYAVERFLSAAQH